MSRCQSSIPTVGANPSSKTTSSCDVHDDKGISTMVAVLPVANLDAVDFTSTDDLTVIL